MKELGPGIVERNSLSSPLLSSPLLRIPAQTYGGRAHEPALTPSLSHPMGEGARRAGEGNWGAFMAPMRAKSSGDSLSNVKVEHGAQQPGELPSMAFSLIDRG